MGKEFDVESLKNLKKTVVKCITDLGKKSDLTPQETKAAFDGALLYDWLCDMIDDCKMEEDEDYAERGSYRRGSMHSYGYYGHPSYTGREWRRGDMPMHYAMNEPYYDGMSERRMHGYSRHSIGDRAIEKLENLMDGAGSEYEKEQLHKFIRMIRAAADEG